MSPEPHIQTSASEVVSTEGQSSVVPGRCERSAEHMFLPHWCILYPNGHCVSCQLCHATCQGTTRDICVQRQNIQAPSHLRFSHTWRRWHTASGHLARRDVGARGASASGAPRRHDVHEGVPAHSVAGIRAFHEADHDPDGRADG